MIQQLDLRGRSFPAVQEDAFAELLLLLGSDLSGDLHDVRFLDVSSGGGDAVREIAVVGKQQQALAVIVESSYRVDALLHTFDQVHYRVAALRVGYGRDVRFRLVQRDVNQLSRRPEKLAVDFDVVAVQVGFAAEFRDGFAVDRNSTFCDHLLGFATAGYTGAREDLL